MKCPNYAEFSDFVNGTTTDNVAARVQVHLDSCDVCRRTLDTSFFVHGDLLPVDERFEQEPEFVKALKGVQSLLQTRSSLGECVSHTDASDQVPGETTFAREYRLLSRLGRGGMGVVYRARHLNLHRDVALKTLPAHHHASSEHAARFEREIKIVGRLDHPNIVRALDARVIQDVRFLVMEFIPGFNLSEIVTRCGPLAIADACEIARTTADALHYAHERQILHRDVKPQNVMVSSQGCVKLLDLGLARIGDHADDALTTTSQIVGTLDYIAPEQFRDDLPVDHRADIYGLGCTLYFLIAGRPPFSKQSSPFGKLMAHNTIEAASVQSIRPDCPLELAKVISRLIAKRPEARYASAADARDALKPFCADANFVEFVEQNRLEASQRSESPLEPADLSDELSKLITSCAPSVVRTEAATRHSIKRRRRSALIALALFVSLMAAWTIQLTWKTAHGTLEIEADEIVATAIEGAQVTLRDLERDKSCRLAIGESKLAPGQYELIVKNTDSGLSFSTQRFSIVSGEATVVRVTLKPQLPKFTGNVERQIAEFAFSRGAESLGITTPKRSLHRIENRSQIPDEFKLIEIDFSHSRVLRDNDLERLGGLEHLRTLILADVLITDQGLKHLANIPSLIDLHFTYTNGLTADGLSVLQKLPNLVILIIAKTDIGLKEVQEIGKLAQVERLTLTCDELTDDSLAYFASMKNLRGFHLGECNITGVGMRHLNACAELEFISLETRSLTDEGVAAICSNSQLNELGLHGCNATDATIAKLSALPNLKNVFLGDTAITNDCLRHLAVLSNLEGLFLTGTKVSDEFLVGIHQLQKLRALELNHTLVTDAGLPHLHGAAHLQRLDLRGSKITLNGLKSLRNAIQNCVIASDFVNR